MNQNTESLKSFTARVGRDASAGKIVIIPGGAPHQRAPEIINKVVSTFGPTWKRQFADPESNKELVRKQLAEWDQREDMPSYREGLESEARYKRGTNYKHEVGSLTDSQYADKVLRDQAYEAVSQRLQPSGLIFTDQLPQKHGWADVEQWIQRSRLSSPEARNTRNMIRNTLGEAFGKDRTDIGVLQDSQNYLESPLAFTLTPIVPGSDSKRTALARQWVNALNTADSHRVQIHPIKTSDALKQAEWRLIGDAFGGITGDSDQYAREALQRLTIEAVKVRMEGMYGPRQLPPTIIIVSPWNLPDGFDGLTKALSEMGLPSVIRRFHR